MCPNISRFCVNSENGLEAFSERRKLRTMAKVKIVIVPEGKIIDRLLLHKKCSYVMK